MKGIAIIAVLVLIAGAVTLFILKPGYFTGGASGPDAEFIRVPGVVEAREVVVSAQTGGRIQELKVDEGSWVKADSVIAVLDRAELEDQRQQQEALILQLKAKLNQAKQTKALQQVSTQDTVERARAHMQAAKSRQQQAMTELKQLQRDLKRDQALFEANSLTRQDYERQLTAVQSAKDKVRSLGDQVSAATADFNLARANRRQVGVAQQEVLQTEALLKQAQAQLAQTNTRIGYTVVRAPLTGMVSLRVAASGEMIRPGDPIVTIVDLNDVWVKAGVEETVVAGELIGHPLNVQLASGEEIQGNVVAVSPEGSFATQRDVSRVKRDIRTFDLKVRLPNPNHTVHPGMTAYVLLPKTLTANTPREANAKGAIPSRNY